MTKVEKAFYTLKGYCEKHAVCDKACRFYDKEECECVLRNCDPICDWKLPGEKKYEG